MSQDSRVRLVGGMREVSRLAVRRERGLRFDEDGFILFSPGQYHSLEGLRVVQWIWDDAAAQHPDWFKATQILQRSVLKFGP